MRKQKAKTWLLGVASAAIALGSAGAARAQEATSDEEISTAADIVVVGDITYRNRVEGAPPVLDYGLDYFQRFEPLTVGDMLKRTPSTAFVSDVLEFDGVRLRGLDPGYTQVLINGERTPGSGLDRSFFVDRIPAELVERVEIVRSASANRSGDAVAGALNIVLRDSYSFNGAFVRAGALRFSDDEIVPVFGAVVSGPLGPGRGIAGINVQGRHNPKEKVSFRFEPDGLGGFEFDNREDQSDVRDGTDYSFNGEYTLPVAAGELQVSGFYVRTDRTETELSREGGTETPIQDADLTVLTPQFEDILQENVSLEAEWRQETFGGETEIELGFAEFTEDVVSTEEETEFDPFPTVDDFGGTRTFTDQTDREWTFEVQHQRDLGGVELEVGIDYADKERDALIAEAEISNPGDPYPAPSAVTGGFYSIEETRLDGYAMLSGGADLIEWEAGLRYETTEVEVIDNDTATTDSADFGELLPSAHVRFNLSENDRVNFSVARTVRRPNFDYLAPAVLEEEPTEDNDFQGNPQLEPEKAWGFDAGYEHRIARSGVAGINFFYREVEDLIELASTGVVSSEGSGFVFEPRNVGDGAVWGVEFDLSAPLTPLGMENTGVFLNYSWLDSEVTDPVTGGERRFNDQAKSVLNAGFIQDIPSWAAAFGLSYREQGDAFSRVQGEEVTTTYSGDLEFFAERRFGERFTLRFTASNLLDAEKEETFVKWDTLADQLSGDPDDINEFERESENAGPVFQLVGRMAF